MAHYAFLDENNIVTEVIVGIDENQDNTDWEIVYSEIRGQVCKRTSYNTVEGEHLFGGVPFRKNYAGIGYHYDEIRDAFIPPKIFDSWVLDEDKCIWVSPILKPDDGLDYYWDEDKLEWIEIEE
jgi:hypothetical protein